jgi:hypothetical protein
VDTLKHGHEFLDLLPSIMVKGGYWHEGLGQYSLREEPTQGDIIDELIVESYIVKPVLCLVQGQPIEEVGVFRLNS